MLREFCTKGIHERNTWTKLTEFHVPTHYLHCEAEVIPWTDKHS